MFFLVAVRNYITQKESGLMTVKIKRIISLMMAFAVGIVTFTYQPVMADDETNEYENMTMDELYSERGRLSLNFADNADLIAQIDKELEERGVEEISAEEVYVKLNGTTQGRAALPVSTTVKWTSTRQVYA